MPPIPRPGPPQDASAVTHFVFGRFALATVPGLPGPAHDQHAQHRHDRRNNRRRYYQHVGAYSVAQHGDVQLIVLRTTETDLESTGAGVNVLDGSTCVQWTRLAKLAHVWFSRDSHDTSHGLQDWNFAREPNPVWQKNRRTFLANIRNKLVFKEFRSDHTSSVPAKSPKITARFLKRKYCT